MEDSAVRFFLFVKRQLILERLKEGSVFLLRGCHFIG